MENSRYIKVRIKSFLYFKNKKTTYCFLLQEEQTQKAEKENYLFLMLNCYGII